MHNLPTWNEIQESGGRRTGLPPERFLRATLAQLFCGLGLNTSENHGLHAQSRVVSRGTAHSQPLVVTFKAGIERHGYGNTQNCDRLGSIE